MTEFDVERKDVNGVSVLYIKGYLDAHTAPDFEQAIRQLLDEGRFKIVVNFKDLSYISSAGLGVFMGFIEEIRNNKGDIKLSNMNDKVFRIFDLLGFPSLYEIFQDEQEAIEKFQAS